MGFAGRGEAEETEHVWAIYFGLLGETLMIPDDGTRRAANFASNNIAKVFTLAGRALAQAGATIVGTTRLSARSEGAALAADGKTVAVG